MPDNPCPPPGKVLLATNGRNNYSITVIIQDAAWNLVPSTEQDQAISVLNATPVSILNIAGKGNGIKRESNCWSIHTQSDKSLLADASTADMGRKAFTFDKYKKRPGH